MEEGIRFVEKLMFENLTPEHPIISACWVIHTKTMADIWGFRGFRHDIAMPSV